MASRPERLLRGSDTPLSASFLELFFDLAFVLALSQLVDHLLHDLNVVGVLRTGLLLTAVWWIWVTTTWLIIALGEVVLVAGLAYADTDLHLPATAAFLLVFATAVLIGLLYLTPAGQLLAPAIEHANPTRLAVRTGYLHLVMIGGLLVTAVGAELSIAHPTEEGDLIAVVIVLGGPTLFLIGRILFSLAIHRRLSWPRVAALFALSGAAAALRLPLLAVSAVATGVVLVVVVLDRAGVFSYRSAGKPD
ncbi:low temperature requirement protein A [Micromonospora sp. CA-249363]|uniref:low temperature requirement protein A n=1 Tax=Micromonospora sp. CA-249363 TaxID=3239963 RepID=UPI003D8DD6DA